MKKLVSSVCLSFILFSCGGSSDSKKTIIPEQIPVAQNYVSEIIQIMKDHALTRYEVDWGNLETEVHALAQNAQTIEETYPAITLALELINTNHSQLVSSTGRTLAYHSDIICFQPFDMDEPDVENIGYVRVDGFSSSEKTLAQNFATKIQKTISEQDSSSIKGWIVDLRDNSGGNMWPMIAGLGPLLGEGINGYFFNADEESSIWKYENGASYNNETALTTVEEPYVLINPEPKIAVLSSSRIASSGEATLIAFKKLPNAKVFGHNSCGLSTGNRAFTLSDGSRLVLTTVTMADREQIKYGGRVPVDQIEDQTVVVNKAIEWLQN